MRMKKQASTALALGFLSATALTGCVNVNFDEAIVPANYVTVNAVEPRAPLTPGTDQDASAVKITQLIFSNLVFFDENGDLENDVASAILPGNDCQTYDIEIQRDLKFSDGTSLTARDFVRSWSNQARYTEGPGAEALSAIVGYEPAPSDAPLALPPELSGLEVRNSHRFIVHLSRPTCNFISRLATPDFAVLPAAAFDSYGRILPNFGESPFGYGPYMLARAGAWERGLQLTLVPNEHYSGPRRAKNEGITFKFYPEDDLDTPYDDLLNDTLDVLDNLPQAAEKTYRDQLGARTAKKPSAKLNYLVLPARGHFALNTPEGRLRRAAISMSLDRKDIAATLFGETREVATDFLTPASPAHSENVAGNSVLKYYPQKAKANWQAAEAISKWEGSLTLARTQQESGGWAEMAADQIHRVLGIPVKVKSYPDSASLRRDIRAGKITAAYMGTWQAQYPASNAFLWPLFHTDGAANAPGFTNKQVDKLLADAAATPDQGTAMQRYIQAEQILFDELPVVPMWHENSLIGWSTKVAGVVVDWRGTVSYWKVTKE